jgi:hypothetical protein
LLDTVVLFSAPLEFNLRDLLFSWEGERLFTGIPFRQQQVITEVVKQPCGGADWEAGKGSNIPTYRRKTRVKVCHKDVLVNFHTNL